MAVIAYLYPGAGCAGPNLGRDLYNKVLTVRNALDRADKAFVPEGFKVTKACFLGTAEDLQKPSIFGPAMLALCFGITETLKQKKVAPLMAAGYGLGEVFALASLGALPFEEALFFIRRWGLVLEECWQKNPFHVLSVAGISVDELKKKLESLTPKPEIIAEDSPDACVLAGPEDFLKRLGALLASKAVKVSAVYPGYGWPHPSLAEAAQRFPEVWGNMKAERTGSCEIYSASLGGRVADTKEMPSLFKQSLNQPLRFGACAAAMRAAGADTVVDIGPGEALGSFVRKLDTGVRALATLDAKALSSALKLAY